ncbi:PEP-CTERM sorting domain-containing protein [Thalassoglobus sp. JC818]|uniref:PEP-CTERM sorting domain-containing protein n=1 Tax=Thalassoglobus sp. JC818 TaxID=3232136 RepID=UPI003458E0A4
MKTGLRYRVRLLVAAVVSSVAIGSAGVAQAEIIGANSSAYGANVDLGIGLSLTPLDAIVSAGVGPIPVASGNAPASYNDAQSLASVNASGGISVFGLGLVDLIDFNTGVLDVNAQSNVDGTLGSKTTTASATVNNVSLLNSSLLGIVLQSVVSLDATQIQSTATVAGDSGALVASGTTTITGTHGVSGNQALLTVLGVEFLLESSPIANTPVLTIDASIPGLIGMQGSIDVILNEQIVTGDMSTEAGISVNALALRFNDVGVSIGALGAGLLNGEVIISHSEASMQASAQPVPEPGSMALLACGLCSCAGYNIRKRAKRS